MDPQLQDAANAIGKWFAVVEYGVVLLVILVFLCFVALLVTMYQVFRLRHELQKYLHQHTVFRREVELTRPGVPFQANKEESGGH